MCLLSVTFLYAHLIVLIYQIFKIIYLSTILKLIFFLVDYSANIIDLINF